MRNLTTEEFIRIHRDTLSSDVLWHLENSIALHEQATILTDAQKRNTEIREEQLYFAQELIACIEKWVEENLPKTKQREFAIIRQNSMFEG